MILVMLSLKCIPLSDSVRIAHTISFNLIYAQYNESSVWRRSYICLNWPCPRIR